jgi:hypothetical protein
MTALHGMKIEPVLLKDALGTPRPVPEGLLYMVDLFE